MGEFAHHGSVGRKIHFLWSLLGLARKGLSKGKKLQPSPDLNGPTLARDLHLIIKG